MNHGLFEIFEKYGLGDKMNSVCGEMLNLVAQFTNMSCKTYLRSGWKKEKEVLEY
jgi:hypothetical protein